MTPGVLVAVDVGGSSSRAVAVRDDGTTIASVVAPGAAKTGAAIEAAVLGVVRTVLGDVRAAAGGGGAVASIAVGATGMSSLAAEHGRFAARLVEVSGTTRVALAADALTAHLGALGDGPGAVLAVGTGSVALGRTDDGHWYRADGWGHLLGDDGGAAWLGAQGLRRALAEHDGRAVDGAAVDGGTGAGADGATLLAAGRDLLGDPSGWPRAVHGRDDPATLFASFAPAVTALAAAGDRAATELVDRAGRALAATASAVLRDGVPPVLSGVGGVLDVPTVSTAFRRHLATARPEVRLVDPAGDPLAGAVALARALAAGDPPVEAVSGLLWT
ncbi:BadF/BadG/BcrA/BcrD ATPase family protein [Actinotalea sp. K2]|uniref:N-acetylglucosamine kinase n=1 Tax=Actinotalea sp. K2 TaxID=2939438 RepID=UPI0020183C45|nr:BadF/BadG/BcrA/BcrD ATPase family protein [Actinotalea sp. K2]MCL3861717.1 hypothetical protein [Actinotalea sp. K2]